MLLGAAFVLPGAVQSLLGARRWGRIAMGGYLGSLALLVLLLVAVFVRREFVFTLGTSPVALALLTLWLLVVAVGWILTFLDAIRRIRLVTLSAGTRKKFLSVALVCALVVGGGLSYGAVMMNSQRSFMSSIFASGGAQKPVDGRYNIALLGSDAGDGREGIRPDSISVVSIDANTGQTVVIGLPRNMQNVPFPEDSPLHAEYPDGYDCGDECLLNAVYQLGEQHAESFEDPALAGPRAMMDAMSGATGLTVQYYAMIDLKGFESLIDALGGISLVSGVRVPVSAPIDKSTGEHGPVREWMEPGELELDGFHALWYARSREFSSDYERMVRQRCVQEAMLRQLDPATVLVRYQAIAQAAPDVVSTDIPQSMVDRFVDLALEAKSGNMETLNLTPPRVTPSTPDFEEAHALVAEAIAASAEAPTEEAAAGIPGTDAPVTVLAMGVGTPAVLAAGTDAGNADDGEGDRAICYVE
ncbi:LCP family protein [Brevibacterium samyangense]|uniref:Cell envelope-related transcriptional attenuator domain-containing protein n=1 Tax=Brevibacterium samyangense TaxID=366888 RepID=A0ABP5EU56_9MICO